MIKNITCNNKLNLDYLKVINPGVVAFIVSLLIMTFLNILVPALRSLPDEMGAMSFAAYLNGNDWSETMSNPSMYYGSGNAILLLPLFKLIQDPMLRYQGALFIGAIVRSIPALIAVYIAKNQLRITNNYWNLCLLGISCVFFSPTRSSNIDNEDILILLIWAITAILLQLLLRENNKRILTIILCFLQAYAWFSHTRGLLYTLLVILTVSIVRILNHRWLVDLKYYILFTLIFSFLTNFLSKILLTILFTSNSTGESMNTVTSVGVKLIDNIKMLFSLNGIRSFFDLLSGNLVVTFIFSFGTVFISVIYFIKRIIEDIISSRRNSLDCLSLILLLNICGFLVSLFALCITELHNGLSPHIEGTNITRFHFYLRYYGNYFGPILLAYYTLISRRIVSIKNLYIYSIALLGACLIYFYGSVMHPVIVDNGYFERTDWFYYFAPFSFGFKNWPFEIQGRLYYLKSVISVTLIFTLQYLFISKGKMSFLYFLISICLIYQNVYSVIFFDRPFAKSENYYGVINALYERKELNISEILKDKDVLYVNPKFGTQYNVQFFLPSTKLKWSEKITLSDLNEYHYILSSHELDLPIDINAKGIMLDNNEYLYYID